jgi:hypothetical protein
VFVVMAMICALNYYHFEMVVVGQVVVFQIVVMPIQSYAEKKRKFKSIDCFCFVGERIQNKCL